MDKQLISVLSRFRLDDAPVSVAATGCGHINTTYTVTTASGRRYILQRINENTFKNVDGLMDNMVRVTEHIRSKSDDPRITLSIVRTTDGKYWARTPEGCWRVFHYVEGTLCLQQSETDADFYESAAAFGRFQQLLSDFPADTLYEVIPNFHNTPDRFRIFKETLDRDLMGRAKDVQREIDFFLSREEDMRILQSMRDSGQLPTRVTHNDTKLNNVLLDAKTRKALCVIDLDTVMPGLSLYDFGDAIRFGAAAAVEDETDLSKMSLNLDLFRTFTRGYVSSCPGLTPLELDCLSLGAKTMTMECGMRFLTDYLDGDHYFAIHRPGHNLDRARTQIKLASDMELKWDAMQKIVEEEKTA